VFYVISKLEKLFDKQGAGETHLRESFQRSNLLWKQGAEAIKIFDVL